MKASEYEHMLKEFRKLQRHESRVVSATTEITWSISAIRLNLVPELDALVAGHIPLGSVSSLDHQYL